MSTPHTVKPSQFIISSGQAIEVETQVTSFRQWTGVPMENTYGGKAVIDYDGEPLFAELAILRSLQKLGFDGVWVDNYRKCFRNRMSEKCMLPPHAQELFNAIVLKNGGKRHGCWDVFAWKDGHYLFVESKQRSGKYKDRMQKTQSAWLEAALKAGVDASCFRICNWDVKP